MPNVQTCQVSLLRMSAKELVKPPQKCFKHSEETFLGTFLRLAEIAFHGISAVKSKCRLTIY